MCNSRFLCKDKSCTIRATKVFAQHPKSTQWSSKNNVNPDEVFLTSNKKYWFDCDKCNHDFLSSPGSIVSKGSWCIYCAKLMLCDDINCQECYDKSFESNPKKIYWSSKNKLKPREVFKKSSTKYWFVCSKCNHEFDTTPFNEGRR